MTSVQKADLSGIIKTQQSGLQSATDFAASVLRKGILNGVLAHGTPLRQEDLARQLSISRVPIREALRKLEAEGLVSFRPRYGFTVARFDLDALIEFAEIRFCLENLALQSAIEHHTDESIRTLEDALRTLNAAETSQARDERQRLHQQFHLSLYAPCGKERLLSMIDTQFALYESFSRIGSSQFPLIKDRDIAEHKALFEAIANRDKAQAHETLKAHIMGQAYMLAEKLKSLSDQQDSALEG